MARRIEPHEFIAYEFKRLEALARNLLVENKNLKPQGGQPAYYLAQYPQTASYVAGPLREQAEAILERIAEVREIAVEYADITKFDDAELRAEIARRHPREAAAPAAPSLKEALKEEVRAPAEPEGAIRAADTLREDILREALAPPSPERPRVHATAIEPIPVEAMPTQPAHELEPHAGDHLKLHNGIPVIVQRSAMDPAKGLRLLVAEKGGAQQEIGADKVASIWLRRFDSLPLAYGAPVIVIGGEHTGREGTVYGYEAKMGDNDAPILKALVEMDDPSGGTEIESIDADDVAGGGAA